MKKVVILLHFRMCFLPFPKDSMDICGLYFCFITVQKSLEWEQRMLMIFLVDVFAQNTDLNLRWSNEIRVSLKRVEYVGFCVSREGKNWQWRTYHISHPNGNKKGGGHLFSTLTKKTNWQTNSSQSLSGQGQEGKKWASGFLYPFLLRCLPFLFPQIEKLCFEKKMKTLSWWLHSGKLSFQTSIKRGDDKRFFFYGQKFQNKKGQSFRLARALGL